MAGSVLIVDDEQVVLKSCERILCPEGYNVLGVLSAREAMDILKDDKYDILITDLMMPDMSGQELIQWIHNNAPHVGVVVITGYPSQESIKDALQYGIIDYLPKPFSPQLLIDVTEKALNAQKARSAAVKPTEDADIEAKSKEVIEVIERNKVKSGALIPTLQQVQDILGYLPPNVLRVIAKEFNIPVSEAHSVVSFYSFFSMKPKGKNNVKVCMGTACYVKRATEILDKLKGLLGVEEGEVTKDKRFSLETVRCLGACGLAPVLVVNKDVYGRINPVKVSEVIDQCK